MATKKGRKKAGLKRPKQNPRARLSRGQVRTIRSKARRGSTYAALAGEFGVSDMTIMRAVTGQGAYAF